MNNYCVYHLHTELSLLDSCTNYKLYVNKAKELDQTSICFTEHGNTFNWIEKKMYCDKNNIKYLHGVEVYLTEQLESKIRDNYHTILIGANYEGVKEINLLIDKSTQEDHFYYKNRISFDEFLNISGNVIKISACLASTLNRLDNNNPYLDKLLNHYDYYEIQPHNVDQQKSYNKKLYEWSKQYNKPLIAGTDTHSLNKYKAECRSILQKAKKIEYDDEDSFDLTYKSYDELVDMFNVQNCLPQAIYLEAIQNTNVMADSVESFELDLSFKYPKLYDNEEEIFMHRIKEKLLYKVNNGIISKSKIIQYKDNIKEELKVFKAIGMTGFILFMSEMTTWCRENNIPFGYCRGSVGGSIIAYILDIIDLDPIVWNTVFSRFANISRKEIGDIDLDFSPSQRDLVYNYIIDRFGKNYTSFILAIGTISDKGTIDEIGRALDYPLDLTATIKSKYEENSELTKKEYPELFYYFDGLLNTAISQSIHPAGIVASPISLPDNYGTVWRDGKRVTAINMEEIHEVSLVKYDILGLKNIEIIKDTCELAGLKYPLSHELNWNDENVWADMITSNVGIFQFESPYAFKLLKDYIPQRVNDMSLVNASLRPSGASYRDRLIEREFNENPSKQIDDLLADNNGFLVFQEDVIAFLQRICGLDGSEADNIRRAIGRKDKDRLEKALPQILDGYCSKSDQPREVAEEEAKTFIKIIEDASSYMFGYNHSTGYSMIGYTCAYYRYYYPTEFITAYLNNAHNEDDIKNGTNLAQIKNIQIKPIKFRHSKGKYTIDKNTNIIYKGISSIKFCNEQIADELYLLKDNVYDSFVDLLADIKTKTSVNSRQIKILTILNFFSEFGKAKKLLTVIDIFENLFERKQVKFVDIEKLNIPFILFEKYSANKTEKMFKDIDNMSILKEYENSVENKGITLKERLQYEFEYMGYIEYTNDTVSNNLYYVTEFKVFKEKTKPYLQLYKVNTGETIKAKITKSQVYLDTPFSEKSVLLTKKIVQRPKMKMVNGKWEKSKTEFDNILEEYDVY